MAEIKLTIEGQEARGEEGDTILQVCQKNDIYVPTLCHLDSLSDIGACRMCIAEIGGSGRTRISASCTTPALDGMIVSIDTEDLNAMRKNILELLLVNGNHHCMYCVESGDCELQEMAYQMGIDHIRLSRPVADEQIHVDSSHRYMVVDRSRCILCYRCVRACSELSGNRALGIGGRGSKATIITDMRVARGESTCIDCGTCLQVCPTGALTDRRSSYMSREVHAVRTKSTCLFCSVGCATELVTRGNYIVAVDGDWDGLPNKGLLCQAGRFAPLYDEKRQRAVKPKIRQDGGLTDASWDQALDQVANRMKALDGSEIGGLVSTHATNESMEFIAEISRNQGVDNVACLEGKIDAAPEDEFDLEHLAESDMVIVVGADLVKDHQVVGFFVKRGVMEKKKPLVVVDSGENGLASWANLCLKPDEVDKAAELYNSAEHPAVIYGEGAGAELDTLRKELAGRAKFFWMAPGSNSRGALAAGLGGKFNPEPAKCIYILACENEGPSGDMLKQIKGADFVVVQTCYMEPWSEFADVILPSVNWAEKDGTITNMEGRILNMAKAVRPPEGVRGELEILEALMDKLGYSTSEAVFAADD